MSRSKKIIILTTIVLLTVYLAIAVVYASKRHHSERCLGIEVILHKTSSSLLMHSDIHSFIEKRHINPTGKLCDSIDISNIEKELCTMPLVLNAECCILRNGIMRIDIFQRTPLFHIHTSISDYCIDDRGMQMTTPQHLPDTIIHVTGDVTISFATENLYPLICFMYSDGELSDEFRRISVGRGNQINLYSNRYPYCLIMAGDNRYEPGFEKFKKFREWDKRGEHQTKYKTINLQFRGQIVCKRK